MAGIPLLSSCLLVAGLAAADLTPKWVGFACLDADFEIYQIHMDMDEIISIRSRYLDG